MGPGGGKQERFGVVPVVVTHGEHHAWLGDPVVGSLHPDVRGEQQFLKLPDAPFLPFPLVPSCRVIVVVVGRAVREKQSVQLVPDVLVALPGEPGRAGILHGEHAPLEVTLRATIWSGRTPQNSWVVMPHTQEFSRAPWSRSTESNRS